MNPTTYASSLLSAVLALVVLAAPSLGQEQRPESGEVTLCGLPVVELQPAATLQGSLAAGDCFEPDGSYVDIYKFTKFSENVAFTIRVESGAFQPSVNLYNSSGMLVKAGTNTPGMSVLQLGINLPPGTYYPFVKPGTPSGGGNYQIRFTVTIVDIFPSPTFDYDGFWGADMAVYRPSNRTWYIKRSGGVTAMSWGEEGDKLMPADYDGDSKTDIAVFRPSTGVWYIVESDSNTFRQIAWGQEGDIPLAVGSRFSRPELTVFRPSTGTWYMRSPLNDSVWTTVWGTEGDVPIYADFSGDGVNDTAVFRPSEGRWYFRSYYGLWFQDWGQSGDIPVPDDYDNDGRTDIAVYRPTTGEWFLLKTRYGHIQTITWGEPGDIPVPDDYQYDGTADIAVFRPSTGQWFIKSLYELPFETSITQFGEPGDLPAQAHHIMR